MAISNRVLDTTTANVLFGTSTTSYAVTALYLCNNTSNTVTANVFLVANGSTVGNAKIYSNVSIAGFDSYIADTERIILGQGDSVQANCSQAGGLTMTISYVGI